jgi:hypothetical protein
MSTVCRTASSPAPSISNPAHGPNQATKTKPRPADGAHRPGRPLEAVGLVRNNRITPESASNNRTPREGGRGRTLSTGGAASDGGRAKGGFVLDGEAISGPISGVVPSPPLWRRHGDSRSELLAREPPLRRLENTMSIAPGLLHAARRLKRPCAWILFFPPEVAKIEGGALFEKVKTSVFDKSTCPRRAEYKAGAEEPFQRSQPFPLI